MPATTGEGLRYHKGSKCPFQVEVQYEGVIYKPNKHYPYHCSRPHCPEKTKACKRVSCQQLLQARCEQQEQSLSEAADEEERAEAERENRVDSTLRETTLSSTEPEKDFDTGFARTQTYQGHGAGTMKPAGRRLNSNQPNTNNGNGGKAGKKAKRPALGPFS